MTEEERIELARDLLGRAEKRIRWAVEAIETQDLNEFEYRGHTMTINSAGDLIYTIKKLFPELT